MTIIQDLGTTWIESHVMAAVSLPTAAGLIVSATINLDRPGTVLGYSISCRSGTGVGLTALASLGFYDLTFDLAAFTVGRNVINFQAEVIKAVSADTGTVTFAVMIWMKALGRN